MGKLVCGHLECRRLMWCGYSLIVDAVTNGYDSRSKYIETNKLSKKHNLRGKIF